MHYFSLCYNNLFIALHKTATVCVCLCVCSLGQGSRGSFGLECHSTLTFLRKLITKAARTQVSWQALSFFSVYSSSHLFLLSSSSFSQYLFLLCLHSPELCLHALLHRLFTSHHLYCYLFYPSNTPPGISDFNHIVTLKKQINKQKNSRAFSQTYLYTVPPSMCGVYSVIFFSCLGQLVIPNFPFAIPQSTFPLSTFLVFPLRSLEQSHNKTKVVLLSSPKPRLKKSRKMILLKH